MRVAGRVRGGALDVDKRRDEAMDGGGAEGEFGWKMREGDAAHHVSLLEPHKRFQNAFTMLQKRTEGWKEPVWTDEA